MESATPTLKKIEFAFAIWSVLYIFDTIIGLSAAKKQGADALSTLAGALQPGMTENLSNMVVGLSVLEVMLVIGCGWLTVLFLATGHRWAFSLFIPSCYFSMLGNVWSLAFPDETVSPALDRLLALAYFGLTVVMVHNARILRTAAGSRQLFQR